MEGDNSVGKENAGKKKTNKKTRKRKFEFRGTDRIRTFGLEYDSITCLGKGGFGHVHKARNKRLNKEYAVKVVRCKEKALREVKALSDLNHCNIVRFHTCWLEDTEYQCDSTGESCGSSQSSETEDKYLYIEMELCDKTLRVWIDEKNMQNQNSMPDFERREESLNIAQKIVSGVEYIHAEKFIHRDLKPANIMFGKAGEVKIGDFGLVTDVTQDDDAENLSSVDEGTSSYMAPEQKSGTVYDQKVDIFPLGLIYFELLWNISGHEKATIWDDIRRQKLPEEFSKNLTLESDIIKSMLCPNPEDRPEASDLKLRLQDGADILKRVKDARRDNRTV